MSAEPKSDQQLEIAHVLFIDVVGYSKLLMNEQSEVLQQLNQIVRNTEQFRKAEAAGKLIRIPVGDGMALVFFHSPETPVRAAVEISEALQNYPQIELRMGIHSGPVNEELDVNDRSNVAGAGINMAQRVMECGDAGHILLSKRVADDLAPFGHWRSQLHDLGDCEVKHGESVFLVNLYNDKIGNRQLPQKLRRARQETAGPIAAEPALVIRTEKRSPLVPIFLAGLGLVVGALILLYLPWNRFRGTSALQNVGSAIAIPEKSIAVLPFENLSKEEENAFFAGGVQDEILTNLSKIADLKVISRTSVMKYKTGPERNIREIAKMLGVAHVVEGTVQRAGSRVRVSAQLIDARKDAHLWADHYDRELANIFAIQSEVAQQIAQQLRAKLSPQEKASIGEKPTADLQAYELYNQARAILIYNDPAGSEKSLARKTELLEQATRRDPGFALAYCALARAHGDFDVEKPRHLQLAKQALDIAVRLRPDLGETHRELGRYYYNAGEYERALEELNVAGRLLPNDAEVLRVAGDIDCARGHWDEALANFDKAHALDPRNGEITHHLWQTYHSMRRYKDEAQFLEKAFASDPEYPSWFPFYWATLKMDSGDPAGAKAVFAGLPSDFTPPEQLWRLRFNNALYLRDYDEANAVLAAAPETDSNISTFVGKPPTSWANGLVARLRGDQKQAEAISAAARNNFDVWWANKPKTEHYFQLIARVDAILDQKEQAVREARQAVELVPINKNAEVGPWLVRNLAMIYALVGERDLAIQQLDNVAKIPAGPSYGDLRFNPIWDPLRGDPRFEKIVASLAP
jgi:TolB-like protein/class 3 adenylate cyclase